MEIIKHSVIECMTTAVAVIDAATLAPRLHEFQGLAWRCGGGVAAAGPLRQTLAGRRDWNGAVVAAVDLHWIFPRCITARAATSRRRGNRFSWQYVPLTRRSLCWHVLGITRAGIPRRGSLCRGPWGFRHLQGVSFSRSMWHARRLSWRFPPRVQSLGS